jgi:hypothetical protein
MKTIKIAQLEKHVLKQTTTNKQQNKNNKRKKQNKKTTSNKNIYRKNLNKIK